MDELIEYYTKTDLPRILFNFDDIPLGAFATYLPNSGTVVVRTDFYSKKDLTHPFIQYMFRAFGKPEIQFVKSREKLPSQKSRLLSTHMRSETVQVAQTLGSSVSDVFHILNNKVEFQNIVTRHLGKVYSTQPTVVPAETRIDEVKKIVQLTKQKEDPCVVIRIPDVEIASGGGDGVRFVKSVDEVEKALRSIKWVVKKNALATRIMVERFIPSNISVCTGFYLGENKVIVMTLAVQLLKNGAFIGGTNVLPKKLNRFKQDLYDKCNILAQYAHDLGARGFMDVDWLVGKKIIPVEYNYRESGVTVPEVIVMRANGFQENWDWAHWVFILGINYTKKMPHAAAMMELLHRAGVLFEGKEKANNFMHPLVIPLYAMKKAEFEIVVFWRKGSVSDEDAFEKINYILRLMGSKKRVDIPQM